MPAPKKIRKKALVSLAADAAAGASTRDLLRDHKGVSERVVRTIKRSGLGVSEFREAVAQKVRAAADESLDAYRKALRENKIPPSTLAVSTGIMLTKSAELEGRTAMITLNINQEINSLALPSSESREQILEKLRSVRLPFLPKTVDTGESIFSTISPHDANP
jgi:hypothetical protein